MAEAQETDNLFSLLGEAARDELARRAAQSGLTGSALAAQILARELVEAGVRGAATTPRTEETGQLLLPRLVHELRTPVGSLLMLSEMLEAEANGDNPRAAHNARRVRMLASDILVVLEEIAELSALQRGTLLLHPQAVSVAALLAELERDHRTAAAEAGVELEVHVDPAAPAVVQTDRDSLAKMLQRLVGGAIRTGAGGRVEVRVGPCETTDGAGLCFTCLDHGPPLPPGGARTVFEPFGLADSRTRRSHGGSSLALPIAAATARALGGELTVSSSAASTSFVLVLPTTGGATAGVNGGARSH